MTTSIFLKINFFKIFLTSIIFLISLNSSGQKGQILKIGYRAGYTGFSPAFYTISETNPKEIKQVFKDRVFPTNMEFHYGANSPSALYDVDLSGVMSYIGMYLWYMTGGDLPELTLEKMKTEDANGEKIRGADFDIINIKMAFGKNDLLFGGQCGYSWMGAQSTYDISTTEKANIGFGGYFYYGIGAHYNFKVDKFVMQNSLMIDRLANKKSHDIKGFGIKLETMILMQKEAGFYASPYIKYSRVSKTFENELNRLNASSFGFGLRVGVFLAQD